MTATSTSPATTTWTLDPDHSSIEFAARHMMITTVKGRIGDVRGTIVLDQTDPVRSTAEAEFNTASIDTRSVPRDQHLRSADFLDVENFPTLTFRSTRLTGSPLTEGAGFQIIGDLTIRGVTREVALDATFEGRGTDPWGTEKVSFSADTKIDRRDFGLTWNAALETGGMLVSNDVKIHLEIQAARAAA
jgi:polyisoprenoid-binding protein YceI